MQTAIKPNSFYAYVLASRPKTLGAIISPMLIGFSFASLHAAFNFAYFFIALICALSLQVLANFLNDYCDFKKGADSDERLGPKRAMQMGWLSDTAMKSAIACMFLISALCGLYLVVIGGVFIFLLGVFSLLACIFYSAGPIPLSRLGFSEGIVFLFCGPLPAIGAYYLMTHSFHTACIIASVSSGFLASALMLSNNLRDRKEDRKNNKHTLAVFLGERVSRYLLVVFLLLSFIPPLLLVFAFSYSPLLLYSIIPLMWPLRYTQKIISAPISRNFNTVLAVIGQSNYLFGLIFSIGLMYA